MKGKNRKKKITALMAAALYLSSSSKSSNAEDTIIVINDDISTEDPSVPKDVQKEDGGLLWPATFAVLGGILGAISDRKEGRSPLNGATAGYALIGTWVPLILRKFRIKDNYLVPAFNYFSSLFGAKSKNNVTDGGDENNVPNIYKPSQQYIKAMERIERILYDFVKPVVILQLQRFSELSEIDKDKIRNILLEYSYKYEFVNSIVTDSISNVRINEKSLSMEEMCDNIKKMIYEKIKNSLSEYETEGLIENLTAATAKLNEVILELDQRKTQNI